VSRLARGTRTDGNVQVAVVGGEKGAAEARWTSERDFHCVVHSPVRLGRNWTRHNPFRPCRVLEGDCWQILAEIPARPGSDLWAHLEMLYRVYLVQGNSQGK
jgi:hypothetical protein